MICYNTSIWQNQTPDNVQFKIAIDVFWTILLGSIHIPGTLKKRISAFASLIWKPNRSIQLSFLD